MGLLATSLKLTGSGSKHPFLTPALDTDEWLAPRSSSFAPRIEARCPFDGRLGWGGDLMAGPYAAEKGNIFGPHLCGSFPRTD
jgi:hypothetical protein